MMCYHRKLAYLDDKGLHFKPVLGARVVSVPCGKCPACRANNASQWATRVMHESEFCDSGCFITLTYNPAKCPKDYALRKKDLQDFLKRLRRHIEYHKLGHIRAFFGVGEYGEKYGRPHYHLIILGWSPNDLQYHSESYSGETLYTSKTVEDCWGKGFAPVGVVKSEAAAYVARYGRKIFANSQGKCKQSPFMLASRNIPLSNGEYGALGAEWVVQNHKVLRFGYLNHPTKAGVKRRIPEYYFDLLERWYPDEYEVIKQKRYDYAMEMTNGYLIIDDPNRHIPTVYLEATPRGGEAMIETLRSIVGDVKSDDFDVLRRAVEDVLRREEEKQNKALQKLKRNYE